MSRICEAHQSSSPDDLWVFTDGSVDDSLCETSMVFFVGTNSAGHFIALCFQGHHSSTQEMLVALGLAFQHTGDFGCFCRITFMSDSQPMLKAILHRQGGSELVL